MDTQSETVLKSFQTEFLNKNQNIIIPLLQRDYVQGGRLDVIDPFLNKLIDAISKEQTQINLEYIYGYNTENGFVPIDGQQRLITLWLLHLYIYAKNNEPLPTGLKFESREFADNFCTKLREKLCGILNPPPSSQKESSDVSSKVKDNENIKLKEEITDCDWFVTGWLLDTTVRNMLNTLQLIDDKKNSIPDKPHTDNITFDFLDMKGKGLDDDVYVKMNGRGRPLTYFENLKSWMDKCIEKTFGKDDEFTRDWKIKIDNEWTDLFWQNRNTTNKHKHPEEIDDAQIRFFYSMLLLYWKMKEKVFLSKIATEETTKLNYISFLNEWEKESGKLSEESTIKDIQPKTFSLLLNGNKMLPLYWIEKIEIFNKEVFEFLKNGLESLGKIKDFVNELPEKIVNILDFESAFEKEQTILYQIAFKEASYAKTLPLLYALTKTPARYKNKTLYIWVRLWRNIVINSSIDAKNISDICGTIDDIASRIDTNNDLYQVVSNFQWQKGIGVNEKQFKEEIAKANQILLNSEDSSTGFSEDEIICAESHPLLKGCISTLFENDNCEKISFGKSIKDRVELLDKLWRKDNDKDYTLVKVLISLYDKDKPEGKLYLNKNQDNWKSLVTDKLKECFRKNMDNSINPNCEGWKSMLANTQLIENSRESGKILSVYGEKIVLWATSGCRTYADGNVILDSMHNNSLLSKLFNNQIIKCDKKINNCDFFWGWDINFNYSKEGNLYNFQWNTDGNVYLIENNETKKRFSVEGIDKVDAFERELKKLIEE